MSDEILNEIELRLEEAKRKLAWFEEEYRELQLCPVVRDFESFYGKWGGVLSPEEASRRDQVRDSFEAEQVLLNQRNRSVALQELNAAKRELHEYKVRNKLYVRAPIQKRKASRDGDDDSSKIATSINECGSPKEINSVQLPTATELRQRK